MASSSNERKMTTNEIRDEAPKGNTFDGVAPPSYSPSTGSAGMWVGVSDCVHGPFKLYSQLYRFASKMICGRFLSMTHSVPPLSLIR